MALSPTFLEKLNPGVNKTPGLDSLFATRVDFTHEYVHQERVRRNCA